MLEFGVPVVIIRFSAQQLLFMTSVTSGYLSCRMQNKTIYVQLVQAAFILMPGWPPRSRSHSL